MHKITTPAWRRAAYFLVAAILALLVAVGVITEAQYDSWSGVVQDLLPLIGTVALSVAGAKTHRGSDDYTTREDVDLAYQRAAPRHDQVPENAPASTGTPVYDSLIDRAKEHVDNALSAAQQAYQQATKRD